MKANEVVKIGNHVWKQSEGVQKNSMGASRGLHTLCNIYEVRLKFSYQNHNWILTKFKVLKNDKHCGF